MATVVVVVQESAQQQSQQQSFPLLEKERMMLTEEASRQDSSPVEPSSSTLTPATAMTMMKDKNQHDDEDDGDQVNQAEEQQQEDGIPTIVLQPELAIQTLDVLFSQCTTVLSSASAKTTTSLQQPTHDLKATSIESFSSTISSETVLFVRPDDDCYDENIPLQIQQQQQKRRLRPTTRRRRRAAFLSATVIKENQDVALGMGLRKNKHNGSLHISSMRPNCLLSDSPFRVGDKLISINNVDCTNNSNNNKMSLSSVAKLLKTTTGLLTVVVEHPEGDPQLVESMIMKATPTSRTGLGIAAAGGGGGGGATGGGRIKVSSIDSRGIFASSLLNRRDTILSINGTPTQYLRDAQEAAKLVTSSQRTVTIIAERKSDNGAVVAAASAAAAVAVAQAA